MNSPKLILLFSGKRKSGKDYICEHIKATLGEGKCTIVRISGPLKSLYAKNHNLNFQELLTDGPYKENYRCDMIGWSDKIREHEPGYFCKAACDMSEIRPVWIVSDIRRKTDVEWFKKSYNDKIRTIRVETDNSIREKRGWVFKKGVDDVASECDLDDFEEWDLKIRNNNEDELNTGIDKIISIVNSAFI